MENHSSSDFHVKVVGKMVVPPCLPSPKSILYLSNIDDHPLMRFMSNVLLVYKSRHNVNILACDPAKVIREALSKVLVHYYPFAGRMRNAHNGKLQVECTGDGALFVEATTFDTLSVLGDMDNLKLSFQQLTFEFPPQTDISDIHPLVIQVTRFSCGGFVLGVSFHHSLCDGRRVVQFLNALAQMARGDSVLSVQPIWQRELLKPRDPPQLEFHGVEMNSENAPPVIVRSLPINDEVVQSSFVINSNTIEQIRQCLVEEGAEFFSSFEVVAALSWRARTKALGISDGEEVRLMFGVDVRKLFNPPLPDGYYGNCVSAATVSVTALELLDASLLHVVKIIKNAKQSLNDSYLRSSIDFLELNRFKSGDTMDVDTSPRDLAVSDCRKLGFEGVDFGWGKPMNGTSMQLSSARYANIFMFSHPMNGRDGIKILMWMPQRIVKLFETEMLAQTLQEFPPPTTQVLRSRSKFMPNYKQRDIR